jgi:HEAT repeat protein
VNARDRGRLGRGWRRRAVGPAFSVLAAAAVSLGLSGCAAWDDITVHEPFDKKVHRLFSAKPEPLQVLADSNSNGDERADALRRLREPLRYGGSQEDQDVAVKVLTTAARTELNALCRLAAIQTLRDYQDPRVVTGLVDAYFHATRFPPETATIIRCQALEALGVTGQPAAVETLVRVLRQPPVTAEAAEAERQQQMDERIAAARALGHFKQPQAAEALVVVLRGEQDVALRDRAQESLQQMTGQDLPQDAQAWADYLHQPGAGNPVVNSPPAPPQQPLANGPPRPPAPPQPIAPVGHSAP